MIDNNNNPWIHGYHGSHGSMESMDLANFQKSGKLHYNWPRNSFLGQNCTEFRCEQLWFSSPKLAFWDVFGFFYFLTRFLKKRFSKLGQICPIGAHGAPMGPMGPMGPWAPWAPWAPRGPQGPLGAPRGPVSYTHLTLPTILLV